MTTPPAASLDVDAIRARHAARERAERDPALEDHDTEAGRQARMALSAAMLLDQAHADRGALLGVVDDAWAALSSAERKLESLEARFAAIKVAALALTDAIHRVGDFDPETRVGRAVDRVDVLIHGDECPYCRGDGTGPMRYDAGSGDVVEPDCKTCRGIGAVMKETGR